MDLIKLGFFGSSKVDNLLYLGRIYEKLGVKVCIVDASQSQEIQYYIPDILDNNRINYYNIEFIINLNTQEKISSFDFSEFSVIIFDFGFNDHLINKMIDCNEIFLVTDFNKKNVYKSRDIINKLFNASENTKVIRVFKDYLRTKIKEKYIEYVIFKNDSNLIKEKYTIPYKNSEKAIKLSSQYEDRFIVKNLSKESLRFYMDIIFETTNKKDREIKRAYKTLRKKG